MKQVLPALIITIAFLTSLLPMRAGIAASMPVQVAGPSAIETPPATSATHVVKKGNTLYSISKRYGTTVAELMRANQLKNYTIYVGQILLIPSSSTSGYTVHTVVRGNTLYSLSKRYGTTVDAIKRANRLTGTHIYVGQRLHIPSTSAPPAGSTSYTVVRGDTLYSIAKGYGTTVSAIMAANNLSSSLIYVGQILYIPATATPIPTVTPTGTVATPTSTSTGTLIVTGTPTSTPTATPTPTVTATVPSSCDPAYPDFCIPPPPPNLICDDVLPNVNFTVLPPDPHGFDRDGDGRGCDN